MSCCSTAAATTRPAPTSSDEQWAEVTRIVAERGLLPFVDIAYQGFGARARRGCGGPARAARRLRRGHRGAQLRQEFQRLSRPRRVAVRQDRQADATGKAMAHVSQRAREMWSMPPDHGAAAVRIVLDDRRSWPPTGGSSSTRCATGSIRCARGSPRADPRLALHRQAIRHVLDAAAQHGAGRRAARDARDLHGRQRTLQRRRHVRCGDRPIYRRRSVEAFDG